MSSVVNYILSFIKPSSLPSASPAASALIPQPQALNKLEVYLLPHIHRDLIPIILSYMVEVFGSKEWQKIFGVDVGPVPELPNSFFKFWYGPDPIYKDKEVWETHLPPVFRPKNVTYNGKKQPYNLRLLSKIANKAKGGNQSRCSDSLPYNQHKKNKAGPACFIVMRNDDVLGRGLSYDDQIKMISNLNAEYELSPTMLDLATVVMLHHATTGERYLGDSSGKEGCWTYSHCIESVVKGNKTPNAGLGRFNIHACLGRFNIHGLENYYSEGSDDDVGISGLRKFQNNPKSS